MERIADCAINYQWIPQTRSIHEHQHWFDFCFMFAVVMNYYFRSIGNCCIFLLVSIAMKTLPPMREYSQHIELSIICLDFILFTINFIRTSFLSIQLCIWLMFHFNFILDSKAILTLTIWWKQSVLFVSFIMPKLFAFSAISMCSKQFDRCTSMNRISSKVSTPLLDYNFKLTWF